MAPGPVVRLRLAVVALDWARINLEGAVSAGDVPVAAAKYDDAAADVGVALAEYRVWRHLEAP